MFDIPTGFLNIMFFGIREIVYIYILLSDTNYQVYQVLMILLAPQVKIL